MAENIRNLLKDEQLLTQAATSSFMEIDKNKSGYIDEDALVIVMSNVCNSLGIEKPTNLQIKEFMKKLDKSHKGKVSYDNYLLFLKLTLKRYVEHSTTNNEENLRKNQKKDDDVERKLKKQMQQFEKYLEDSGVPIAFQVIFTEILAKKIEPDQVFIYTAMRLRQIGRDIAHLLPKRFVENGLED